MDFKRGCVFKFTWNTMLNSLLGTWHNGVLQGRDVWFVIRGWSYVLTFRVVKGRLGTHEAVLKKGHEWGGQNGFLTEVLRGYDFDQRNPSCPDVLRGYDFDQKNPSSPGGVPLMGGFQTKNPEEEDNRDTQIWLPQLLLLLVYTSCLSPKIIWLFSVNTYARARIQSRESGWGQDERVGGLTLERSKGHRQREMESGERLEGWAG